MVPPLGAEVTLPDGRQGTVVMTCSGYMRPTPGGMWDNEIVNTWRVRVRIVMTSGCATCRAEPSVSFETYDADALLTAPARPAA